MNNKMPYSVPQGYFESLENRLKMIPSEDSVKQTAAQRGFLARFSPYIAIAASFIAAAMIGTTILVKTAEPKSAVASDEEIIEYLIDSGVTLAQLEFNDMN